MCIRDRSKDEKLKKTIDSLQTAIKNTEGYFDEITRKLKLENVKKIKAAYLKNISFFIDTVPLPMQDIYFFNHPHFGEEGLKCFFSTDSLSGGLHELKAVSYTHLDVYKRQPRVFLCNLFSHLFKHRMTVCIYW